MKSLYTICVAICLWWSNYWCDTYFCGIQWSLCEGYSWYGWYNGGKLVGDTKQPIFKIHFVGSYWIILSESGSRLAVVVKGLSCRLDFFHSLLESSCVIHLGRVVFSLFFGHQLHQLKYTKYEQCLASLKNLACLFKLHFQAFVTFFYSWLSWLTWHLP